MAPMVIERREGTDPSWGSPWMAGCTFHWIERTFESQHLACACHGLHQEDTLPCSGISGIQTILACSGAVTLGTSCTLGISRMYSPGIAWMGGLHHLMSFGQDMSTSAWCPAPTDSSASPRMVAHQKHSQFPRSLCTPQACACRPEILGACLHVPQSSSAHGSWQQAQATVSQ